MKKLCLIYGLTILVAVTGCVEQGAVATRIGALEFEKGYPSQRVLKNYSMK
jgi:hypothetical protein